MLFYMLQHQNIFFHKCYFYMSLKKTKTNKIDQQKNKPIKYNYMEKKMTLNSLKKIKYLFLTSIQLTFQIVFSHWSIHGKEIHIYTI